VVFDAQDAIDNAGRNITRCPECGPTTEPANPGTYDPTWWPQWAADIDWSDVAMFLLGGDALVIVGGWAVLTFFTYRAARDNHWI